MSAIPKEAVSDDDYKKKYETLLSEYQEFAYVVSHDLQSPIRQITGFTEILLSELDTGLPDHLKPYSDMIKHAGQEAHDAVEALLEYSRLNTDEKFFKTLDMNEIVAQVLEQFQEKIAKSEAKLTVTNLPEATGDRALISRLFGYLISNALKFRKTDNQTEVEIGAKIENDKKIFFIKDNGIGMNPQKIEEAYIMFRKLNAADDYKGRGAGLTFAKKIVEIHKGSLLIESEPDKGTIVYFTLGL